ncbi:MAG: hypothetical protein J6U45_01740, partial [Alistipes sp.]|nr:hypothetical protein [Alistipes sp.]
MSRFYLVVVMLFIDDLDLFILLERVTYRILAVDKPIRRWLYIFITALTTISVYNGRRDKVALQKCAAACVPRVLYDK